MRQRTGRRARPKRMGFWAASMIMLSRLCDWWPRRTGTAAWRLMWTSGMSNERARPDVSVLVMRRDRRPIRSGT